MAVDSWYRGLTSTEFCTSTYRYRLFVQGKISFLQRRFPAPAPLPFPHFQQRQLHANLAVYRFRCETMTSNTLRSQLLAAKSLCAVPNASHHESMTASLTVHSTIICTSTVQITYQYSTNLVSVCTMYRQGETVPTMKLKNPNQLVRTSWFEIVGTPSKALVFEKLELKRSGGAQVISTSSCQCN